MIALLSRPRVTVGIYIFSIFLATPFLPHLIRLASNYSSRESVMGFVLGVEIFIALTIIVLSVYLFIFRRSKFFTYLVSISAIITTASIVYLFLSNPYELTHLPEYAVLGMLLYRSLLQKGKSPVLQALQYSVLVGLLDECFQGILPNRSFTWYDILLNAMGAGLGISIFWGFKKEQKRETNDEPGEELY
jgi:glycopeptide antibiotics resistance protein